MSAREANFFPTAIRTTNRLKENLEREGSETRELIDKMLLKKQEQKLLEKDKKIEELEKKLKEKNHPAEPTHSWEYKGWSVK